METTNLTFYIGKNIGVDRIIREIENCLPCLPVQHASTFRRSSDSVMIYEAASKDTTVKNPYIISATRHEGDSLNRLETLTSLT